MVTDKPSGTGGSSALLLPLLPAPFPVGHSALERLQVLRYQREIPSASILLSCSVSLGASDVRVQPELLDETSRRLDRLGDEQGRFQILVAQIDRHAELSHERAQQIDVVVARRRVNQRVAVLVLLPREQRVRSQERQQRGAIVGPRGCTGWETCRGGCLYVID